jgi:hypothetical protein
MISPYPFHTVGIDLLGPLDESIMGNKYILTIVDHFTGWPEAIAIPDKRAETIAKALFDTLICRHGAPKYLLSDRGKEFLNNLMQELARVVGFTKIFTTAMHPNSNAYPERLHRFINNTMAIMINGHAENDWETLLPHVLFSYRTTIHETTKYTPFHLVYGRHARLPVDVLFDTPNNNNYHCTNDFVQQLVDTQQKTHKHALDNREKQAYTNKIRQDTTRSHVEFTPNTLILLHEPRGADLRIGKDKKYKSKKFRYKWTGPHKLHNKINPNTYRIFHTGRKVFDTINVNRMIPYLPPDDETRDADLHQAEEELSLPETNFLHSPQVGDLAVVNIDSLAEPFGVGKIIHEHNNGTYDIHWYGNQSLTLRGTYRPGFAEINDKTYTNHYYRAQRKPGLHKADHVRFTNKHSNQTITRKDILLTGLTLTRSRLPAWVFTYLNDHQDCHFLTDITETVIQ